MTSQKTVLFMAANATGHINPLVGIADRMKQLYNYNTVFLLPSLTTVRSIENNGHKLFIATHPDLNMLYGQEKYCHTANFAQVMETMSRQIRTDPLECLVAMISGQTPFLRMIKTDFVNKHDTITSLIYQIKPDLIVLDTWFIPAAVLKLKHIPFVYVSSVNPLIFAQSSRPDGLKPPFMIGSRLLKDRRERERLSREEPHAWQTIVDKWRSDSNIVNNTQHFVHEAYDRMYIEAGFLPHNPFKIETHFSPHLTIYMYPREIDYDQEEDLFYYPARFFRCDSLVRYIPTNNHNLVLLEYIRERRVDKSAVIYFSLGTLASGDLELMQRHLDFFALDTSRLYIVSTGLRGHEIRLNRENMIGEKFLPQTLILQQVDLAIVHGGNNTVTECLHYGVPMIVMPCFGDQADNAQRLEDLQLGRKLNVIHGTREQLMSAIDELLADRHLRQRVKLIGERMRARDDARKVVIMLDKLAREKHLDQSFIEFCRDAHPDVVRASISHSR